MGSGSVTMVTSWLLRRVPSSSVARFSALTLKYWCSVQTLFYMFLALFMLVKQNISGIVWIYNILIAALVYYFY